MAPLLFTLRFLLELALLAAFAIGGWRLPEATVAKLALAIALPVAAAAVWGLLIAPKARVSAHLVVRILIELALFGSAALLLWATGLPSFALVLAVGELAVLAALLSTGHPPGPEQSGHLSD